MDLKYTKKRKGRTELLLKCSKKEQINVAELDLLDISADRRIPDGLLRVADKDLPHYKISYDVSCCFRLKEYFSRSAFSQEEVLGLAAQTIETFMEMEAKRLTLQKLVMDTDYVFYNYKQQRMQFVFCPLQNNYAPKENEDMLRFIKEIVTGAVVRPSEQGEDKISEFLNWLSVRKIFSAAEIGDYLHVPPVRQTQDSIGVPVTTGGSRPVRMPTAGSGPAAPVSGVTAVPPAVFPAPAPAPVSAPPHPVPAIATPEDTCDAAAMSMPASASQNPYSYVPPAPSMPAPAPSMPAPAPSMPAPALSMPAPAPSMPAPAPSMPAPAPSMPAFQWDASAVPMQNQSALNSETPATPLGNGIQVPGDTIDPPAQNGIAVPGDTISIDGTASVRIGVIYHPLSGAEFPISGMLTSIGRDGVDGYGRPVKPDLAVTTDRGVSKNHAIILQENGYFYITDAAGKGNTFVNDQPIACGVNPDGTLNGQWTPLSDGTTIRLAQQGFVFRIR